MPPRPPDHHFGAVQRALDHIEVELRRPIRVTQLARISGMSFWHFQHVFTALVGEPVASYIRRRRLTMAARELRRRRRGLVDIAFDYQFGSHEAFTRAFRATFGLTPREFRREPIALWRSRPRLSLERLRRLQRLPPQPTFVSLPALHLVGITARFFGVNSDRSNNTTIIPPLWIEFRSRWTRRWPPATGQSFGAWKFLSHTDRTDPEEYVYLAARSVPQDSRVPTGMVSWSIPANFYARFTHRGPISRIGETIQHIYAAWLPRSGLERADGFDLELYDHRFRREEPESQSFYFVPIKR